MRTIMKAMVKGMTGGLLVAAVFLPQAAAADGNITLPAGTALHVRLTTTLTSKTNKTGDKFTGVVDQAAVSDSKTIIPEGSLVEGHVAFIKPSKRIKGRAQMRIVLDNVVTPDDVKYALNGTLQEAQGSPCAQTGSDDEGTIKGCGKSKKGAAEGAAIAGAIGAGAGATVGMAKEIDCEYYGNCGGPGLGTDVMYGAGIGAGTALIYSLLRHEKEIILVEGTHLTFIVSRTVPASPVVAAASAPANTN
jgi:hypothetical protein